MFLDIDFPHRHDLDALRNLIPDGWQIKVSHPDLSELTEWTVEARYPDDWPDAVESDGELALSEARSVLESICADLVKHGYPIEGNL